MAKTVQTSENVAYYHNVKYSSIQQLHKNRKMHGVKRVIAFCIFIVILPATLIIMPLYLRHSIFADVVYPVAESDIIEIRDGISSIFCEQHSLHMNTTFNAFQLQSKPEISTNHKHIRLKKSMTLPDDTLEYWGFYLLKGAIVELKVCSRYDGSRILLVKGERNLNTCGLLDHNKNKFGAHYAHGYDKVQVTFETVAEVVESNENGKRKSYLKSLNSSSNNGNNSNNSDQHKNIVTKEIKQTRNIDYQNDFDNDYENHAGEDLSNYDNDDKNNIQKRLPLKYGSNLSKKFEQKIKTDYVQKNINYNENVYAQSDEISEINVDNDDDNVNKTENVSSSTSGKINNNSLLNRFNHNETEIPMIKKSIIQNNNTSNSLEEQQQQNDFMKNIKKIRHRRHKQLQQRKDKQSEQEQEHMKFIQKEHERKKKQIMDELFKKLKNPHNNHNEQIDIQREHQHQEISSKKDEKRNKRDTVYDAKITHGGNALNFTDMESNSVSSFENSLLTCYDGQILLAQSFNPSSLCTDVHYLENGTHMTARHEVEEDGYYYYIFYSDNDEVRNDIHAVFDIYKPTYQYINITDSKGCVNGTNCTFPIKFLSDEIVVVEVPTRDGIEHEEDDITYLISTCHPRTSVYVIFPISVLILILSCSFL